MLQQIARYFFYNAKFEQYHASFAIIRISFIFSLIENGYMKIIKLLLFFLSNCSNPSIKHLKYTALSTKKVVFFTLIAVVIRRLLFVLNWSVQE